MHDRANFHGARMSAVSVLSIFVRAVNVSGAAHALRCCFAARGLDQFLAGGLGAAAPDALEGEDLDDISSVRHFI